MSERRPVGDELGLLYFDENNVLHFDCPKAARIFELPESEMVELVEKVLNEAGVRRVEQFQLHPNKQRVGACKYRN